VPEGDGFGDACDIIVEPCDIIDPECIGEGFGEAFIIPWLIIEPCDIIECDEGVGDGLAVPIESASAVPPAAKDKARTRVSERAFNANLQKKNVCFPVVRSCRAIG